MKTTNQTEEETKTSNEAPDDAGKAQKKVSPAGRIVFLIINLQLCLDGELWQYGFKNRLGESQAEVHP